MKPRFKIEALVKKEFFIYANNYTEAVASIEERREVSRVVSVRESKGDIEDDSQRVDRDD